MTLATGEAAGQIDDPAPAIGFDPDALRERYRAERDKRLRPDGNEQYVEVAGDFTRYGDDPYVDEPLVREALHDEVDVVIVGGGLGGLVTGAKLREAGVGRIRVIDRASDFGGTWYWNRYPGAQCDIESYIYLPLLEEIGYIPKEKYARGSEIWDYCRSIGTRYDLYDDACFQTGVTGAEWDDDAQRWVISTDRGDRIQARFVVMSIGSSNRPKLPAIPGIDTFGGHIFHTSRWDYEYTGGSPEGGLTGLAEKRVGIIGTGATAIQVVPHVGASARELYVFQRTPSSVGDRNNAPTDPAWAESLEPGWQRARMANFTTLVAGGPQEQDLVNDGWTDIMRNLGALLVKAPDAATSIEAITAAVELADFHKMEQIRARVDAVVNDPATAEALKPFYRMFCKRPCFSDDYLPTFNRPNVTLVDTDGKGVDRITPEGVVAGGRLYEIDCLILSTGFEVGTAYTRRAGCEVVGRDGQRLADKWAKGIATFQGFHAHGFPNLFFLGQTQTGYSVNYSHMVTEQTDHVAFLIDNCLHREHGYIEATQEAEDEWVAIIRTPQAALRDFLVDCTPGYYNNEGDPDNPDSLLSGQYPGGADAFFDLLRHWREDGTFSGVVLR